MGGEIAKVLAKDHADMKKKFVFQDWKKINEQRRSLDRALQPRDQGVSSAFRSPRRTDGRGGGAASSLTHCKRALMAKQHRYRQTYDLKLALPLGAVLCRCSSSRRCCSCSSSACYTDTAMTRFGLTQYAKFLLDPFTL